MHWVLISIIPHGQQILKADTIESRERNQSAYDFVFCLFEAI